MTLSHLHPAFMGPLLWFYKNGAMQPGIRISSATILLNGVQVLGPSKFNQNVAQLQETVSLLPTNTITLKVASQPKGSLSIQIVGLGSSLTPEQMSTALDLQSMAVTLFTPGVDPSAGIVTLKQTPGVRDAGLSPDKSTVWIHYDSGLGGLVSLSPPDTLGGGVSLVMSGGGSCQSLRPRYNSQVRRPRSNIRPRTTIWACIHLKLLSSEIQAKPFSRTLMECAAARNKH